MISNVKFSTKGNGWSCKPGKVPVTGAYVNLRGQTDNGIPYGELCVSFNTETWSEDKNGVIYGDSGFIADLRTALAKAGMTAKAVKDIEYSERGMQGDDYVSFDVGADFLADWNMKA